MNIIPDLTLTLWLLPPFLVLVAGMHFILYKPMLAYFEARAQATVGARKEAEALQAQAGNRVAEWEAALARAQGEVTDYRSQRRQAAQAAYQVVVSAARAEADKHIASALDGLRTDANTARAELAATSQALSRDVAVRVLGRPLPQVEA